MINKRNSLSLTLSFLWRIFPLLWWSPWISCVLSSNTPPLEGPGTARPSLPAATQKEPQRGLKNGSCGQWLTPVQSTRQKRRGNGDPAQAVTAERGCRATGGGVWESSSRQAAGFASVGRHTTYMQLRRNPRTSPRTQLYRTAYLTTIREAGREPVAQTRSISVQEDRRNLWTEKEQRQ